MEKFDQIEEFHDEFIEIDSKKYQFSEPRELMDSFRFNLRDKKFAAARFGGTIAFCRDITRAEFFELNDPLRDHICFYSNHGLFQSKRKFESNVKIVGFDFTYNEQLVVVLENGQYFVFDPCDAEWSKDIDKVIQLDLGRDFSEDNIIEAKIIRNGMAFQTKSNKFYFKINILNSPLEEYSSLKITGEISCWAIIPPSFAVLEDKFELQIANPEEKGGITCLSDVPQRTRVELNGSEALLFDDNITVCLSNIRAIASNETSEWIAYLTQNGSGDTEEWILHVLSSEIDDECYRKIRIPGIKDIYAQEKQRIFKDIPIGLSKNPSPGPSPNSSQKSALYSVPRVKINMYWVEKHLVAINIANSLILVGQSSCIISDFNQDVISGNSQAFACVQEIDCLKIVTQNKILLLRHTPQQYLDIFDSISSNPASELYKQSIQNLKNNDIDPSSDDDIRNNPVSLQEGVDGCIVAGSYELIKSRQEHLLKAASFGQIFLQSLQTNEAVQQDNDVVEFNLTEVCKLLRVVYQLNNQKYSRTLTYPQMKHLEGNFPEVLVAIMLRYNYHYIALEVLKFLHLDELKGGIYVHWAGCQIEKNESDSVICEAISNKLQGMNGISFTDIAYKALSHGKPQIALQLLGYEPSIQKRIPVLLWMAKYLRESNQKYFEKALNEALLSKDSTLIYMVIRTIWAQEEEKSYEYFAKEEVLSIHFQKFLRVEMQSQYMQLYNYLVKMKQSQKAGFFLLEQAGKVQKTDQQLKLYEEAKKEFLKEITDKFYATCVEDHIKLIKNCEEFSIPQKRVSTTVEGNQAAGVSNSVSQCLRQLLSQKQDRAVQKLQSDLKITDKRMNFCRMKALIDSPNPSDQALVESTLDQINKKGVEILPELVADQLLKKGLIEIAFNIAPKIVDDQKKQVILQKIKEQILNLKKNPAINPMKSQTLSHLYDQIELSLQLLLGK